MHQWRQHVVRGMEQTDAFTPEQERDGELFSDRIIAGARKDRTKVLAKSTNRGRIIWPAEQHEVALLVQAREFPQQVPDVGPDAEIVQFAGVDANPHS